MLYPAFQHAAGFYDDELRVSAQPQTGRRGWWRYKITCPRWFNADEVVEGEEAADRCDGTLAIREAARRARSLAQATFPAGRTRSRAKFRLTAIGEQLASRRRGVKATMILRIRGHYPGGSFNGLTRWTIRLTAR